MWRSVPRPTQVTSKGCVRWLVTPARSNAAKTSKNSGKYFVYGVLFGSMMTLTTRDMTVCETYAQCVVLPNKANACWCHNINKLNSTEAKHAHSNVCCVTVICGLFVEICWLFMLFKMIVLLRKHFSQQCFSKSGMTIRNPKTNLRTTLRKGSWERTGDKNGHRLRHVWVRGTVDWDMGVSTLGGTGSSSWSCPKVVWFVFFWFLVCYAATQLATPVHQRRIQVVRRNKVARKRLAELNSTPAMDFGSEEGHKRPHFTRWRWSPSTEAQWATCSPHLLWSDSRKPCTLFHRSLSEMQLVSTVT